METQQGERALRPLEKPVDLGAGSQTARPTQLPWVSGSGDFKEAMCVIQQKSDSLVTCVVLSGCPSATQVYIFTVTHASLAAPF